MKLTVSPKIASKLASKAHPVSIGEVIECFATRDRTFLIDDRENNRTDPPTLWFISDTFMGRLLKVVFIMTKDGEVILKTAYNPSAEERWIYRTHSREA